MGTSDERRDAADALRRMANDSMHGLSFQNAIKECVCDRDEGSVSWRGVMRRTADLIDPTCRDMGGSVPGVSAFECSRCGALLNVGDGGGLRVAGHYYDDTPNVSISYCPNCGARVVGHRE